MVEKPGKKPILSIDDIQDHAVQLYMEGCCDNMVQNGMIYLLNTFATDRDVVTKKEKDKERVRLQAYANMVKHMLQLNLI